MQVLTEKEEKKQYKIWLEELKEETLVLKITLQEMSRQLDTLKGNLNETQYKDQLEALAE